MCLGAAGKKTTAGFQKFLKWRSWWKEEEEKEVSDFKLWFCLQDTRTQRAVWALVRCMGISYMLHLGAAQRTLPIGNWGIPYRLVPPHSLCCLTRAYTKLPFSALPMNCIPWEHSYPPDAGHQHIKFQPGSKRALWGTSPSQQLQAWHKKLSVNVLLLLGWQSRVSWIPKRNTAFPFLNDLFISLYIGFCKNSLLTTEYQHIAHVPEETALTIT